MTAILAVMNHKGGVGKTTTTLNMACGLAAGSQRVLIIDMDPQSNAATGLGININTVERGSYELILGDNTIAELAMETAIPNVSLIPATFQLAALSTVSPDDEDPEFWLRESLTNALDDYDFVLIDCPPSFGILSLNALVAAQKVIVPVQSESFAIAGLQQMEQSINDIRVEAEHDLQFRILMTLSDTSQDLYKLVDKEVRAHFKEQVFKTPIPIEPKIAEGAFLGRPVIIHAANSNGARAYINACAECLAWVSELGLSADEHKRAILEGVRSWGHELEMPTQAPQQQLDPAPTADPDASPSTTNDAETNSYGLSIRNGVILALALTAGMALALLGL